MMQSDSPSGGAFSLLRSIVECAGARFNGVESGLLWLTDPETHSTLTVKLEDLNDADEPVKLIMTRLDEKRRAFAYVRGNHENQ